MSLTDYEGKDGAKKQWFEVLVQQLDSHSKKNTENNETEINETEEGNDFPF